MKDTHTHFWICSGICSKLHFYMNWFYKKKVLIYFHDSQPFCNMCLRVTYTEMKYIFISFLGQSLPGIFLPKWDKSYTKQKHLPNDHWVVHFLKQNTSDFWILKTVTAFKKNCFSNQHLTWSHITLVNFWILSLFKYRVDKQASKFQSFFCFLRKLDFSPFVATFKWCLWSFLNW